MGANIYFALPDPPQLGQVVNFSPSAVFTLTRPFPLQRGQLLAIVHSSPESRHELGGTCATLIRNPGKEA